MFFFRILINFRGWLRNSDVRFTSNLTFILRLHNHTVWHTVCQVVFTWGRWQIEGVKRSGHFVVLIQDSRSFLLSQPLPCMFMKIRTNREENCTCSMSRLWIPVSLSSCSWKHGNYVINGYRASIKNSTLEWFRAYRLMERSRWIPTVLRRVDPAKYITRSPTNHTKRFKVSWSNSA